MSGEHGEYLYPVVRRKLMVGKKKSVQRNSEYFLHSKLFDTRVFQSTNMCSVQIGPFVNGSSRHTSVDPV